MKKQLSTVLMVMVCFWAKGQEYKPVINTGVYKDSLPFYKYKYTQPLVVHEGIYADTLIMANDTILYSPFHNSNGQKYSDTSVARQYSLFTGSYNDYDTVPCVILCSDTSIQLVNNISTFEFIPPSVYWIKGYYVQNNGLQIDWKFYPTEYLDEKKKPLNSNIVVWMAK